MKALKWILLYWVFGGLGEVAWLFSQWKVALILSPFGIQHQTNIHVSTCCIPPSPEGVLYIETEWIKTL